MLSIANVIIAVEFAMNPSQNLDILSAIMNRKHLVRWAGVTSISFALLYPFLFFPLGIVEFVATGRNASLLEMGVNAAVTGAFVTLVLVFPMALARQVGTQLSVPRPWLLTALWSLPTLSFVYYFSSDLRFAQVLDVAWLWLQSVGLGVSLAMIGTSAPILCAVMTAGLFSGLFVISDSLAPFPTMFAFSALHPIWELSRTLILLGIPMVILLGLNSQAASVGVRRSAARGRFIGLGVIGILACVTTWCWGENISRGELSQAISLLLMGFFAGREDGFGRTAFRALCWAQLVCLALQMVWLLPEIPLTVGQHVVLAYRWAAWLAVAWYSVSSEERSAGFPQIDSVPSTV